VRDVGESCKWTIPGQGAFGLVLRAELGLNDIVVGSGTLTDESVAGRRAKRLAEASGPGGCMVAMQVGARSRVDVQVAARTDTAKACDIAARVATLVEPKLPKG
jgi:hypothetical protein